MDDLITIIVTIYNREKYLEQCLESVRNQTYKNFECIMVDDGSTDESITIAKGYADNDPRFKLITSEHVGFSAAKNIGLDKAQGKYIIFLDSDDFAYPQWLEFLYDTLVKTGSDISTCFYDEFMEGVSAPEKEPSSDFYTNNPYYIAEYSYLKMNLIYHRLCSCYLWNKLVKKEIYDTIRFKDQMALSDISEVYKIFDKANKVVQVMTPLIHYRRHMESTGGECGKKGVPYFIFRADVLEESVRFVEEHYPQSIYAAQVMILGEINRMIQWVGKEAFYSQIDRQFFRDLLKERAPRYLFPDVPPATIKYMNYLMQKAHPELKPKDEK